MEEAVELYKQLLLTPDSFRKLRNSPEQPPAKTQTISEELISEIRESEISNHEVSDSELIYSKAVAPNVGRVSIPGQDAFMAPASFRPEVDFRSTRFLGRQKRYGDRSFPGRCSERKCHGGGAGHGQSHRHWAYRRVGREPDRITSSEQYPEKWDL